MRAALRSARAVALARMWARPPYRCAGTSGGQVDEISVASGRAARAYARARCCPGGRPGGIPAAGEYNIWYVNPLPTTPDWGRSSQLFLDAADSIGYKATSVGPAQIDIPAMVSNIEQAIADGADGIITCPLDPAAFADVIGKAKEAGAVVASIGCVDLENADFSVGTDNAAFGQVAADFIAEATGGAGQVGILGTDQTTPNQVIQVEAFKEHIAANYPDMSVLVWEGDNSDAGVAAQKIPAMIQAYPEMNYLWIIEGAAPGAVPAGFEEAGLEPGAVGVLAIDAQDSTLKAIEDGWIERDPEPVLVQCLSTGRQAHHRGQERNGAAGVRPHRCRPRDRRQAPL